MEFIVAVLDVPSCVSDFHGFDAAIITAVAPVRVVGDLTEFLASLAVFFGVDLGVHFGF
jgi:hypothetical protein